jgi:hypothetical protein
MDAPAAAGASISLSDDAMATAARARGARAASNAMESGDGEA